MHLNAHSTTKEIPRHAAKLESYIFLFLPIVATFEINCSLL